MVALVCDTGIGIPAEALHHIFDMFSQVDRRIERSTGGLGIGLALVKGLVEMHGGTVTAESDGLGKGSTFTVRLPALGAVRARWPRCPRTIGRPPSPSVGSWWWTTTKTRPERWAGSHALGTRSPHGFRRHGGGGGGEAVRP